MATIITRDNKFHVVYYYLDEQGKRHQKWEVCKTMTEAKQRKTEIEYQQQSGTFKVPNCKTLNELLDEYVTLYGKTKWSISVFTSNTGLIRHYIAPILGDLKIREITVHVLEKYYQTLLKTPAVRNSNERKCKKPNTYVQPPTILKIHNLLKSAFSQAEKWDLIEKNPAAFATLPKVETKKREIWDAQTLFSALENCNDERLKLCINLSFACSLRMGEVLGLTWDCVDVSDESMALEKPSVFINKELQRVNKKSTETMEQKDILVQFPEQGTKNTTMLVLKKPKTPTSTRRVFLPKSVADMLIQWKIEQDATIEALGSEYQDYNLVITGPLGLPTEGSRIRESMQDLIKKNNLPNVCFHSLRHSSITYKLKLNGGDIKSVQGDSGHAQASMVTDQYSHILDENRQGNAKLLEEAFYGGHGAEPIQNTASAKNEMAEKVAESGVDPAVLMKILGNPEMVAMLKMLSKSLT